MTMLAVSSNTLQTREIKQLFTNSTAILFKGVSLLYNIPGSILLSDGRIYSFAFHKLWYSLSIHGGRGATVIKVIGHIRRQNTPLILAKVMDSEITYKYTRDQFLFTIHLSSMDIDKVNEAIEKIKDYAIIFISMNYK